MITIRKEIKIFFDPDFFDPAPRQLNLGTPPAAPHIFRMDKEQVAEVLVSIGTLLELKGENSFRICACANAANVFKSA